MYYYFKIKNVPTTNLLTREKIIPRVRDSLVQSVPGELNHYICLPDFFKSPRVAGRIKYGVLNILMPKKILNQPSIYPAVGQRESTTMSQHVRMGVNLQTSQLTVITH